MDRWAWDQLQPWLEVRPTLPVGALFCILRGPTRGRPCAPAGIRSQLARIAQTAAVRRRFAPHQLRHAHAVEMSREGVPLVVIQRQLGHADLGITSAYLRGIDNTEIIQAVHERPAPPSRPPSRRRCAPGRVRVERDDSDRHRAPVRGSVQGPHARDEGATGAPAPRPESYGRSSPDTRRSPCRLQRSWARVPRAPGVSGPGRAASCSCPSRSPLPAG